ncbi:hypothetical protein M0R45_030176 [Rubus argutus]|uniref:Uncharacterized protein n=1 Tax=Rubus argutus TaxID=59490 RepID=A0AAW1WDY0_RUBAR
MDTKPSQTTQPSHTTTTKPQPITLQSQSPPRPQLTVPVQNCPLSSINPLTTTTNPQLIHLKSTTCLLIDHHRSRRSQITKPQANPANPHPSHHAAKPKHHSRCHRSNSQHGLTMAALSIITSNPSSIQAQNRTTVPYSINPKTANPCKPSSHLPILSLHPMKSPYLQLQIHRPSQARGQAFAASQPTNLHHQAFIHHKTTTDPPASQLQIQAADLT